MQTQNSHISTIYLPVVLCLFYWQQKLSIYYYGVIYWPSFQYTFNKGTQTNFNVFLFQRLTQITSILNEINMSITRHLSLVPLSFQATVTNFIKFCEFHKGYFVYICTHFSHWLLPGTPHFHSLPTLCTSSLFVVTHRVVCAACIFVPVGSPNVSLSTSQGPNH